MNELPKQYECEECDAPTPAYIMAEKKICYECIMYAPINTFDFTYKWLGGLEKKHWNDNETYPVIDITGVYYRGVEITESFKRLRDSAEVTIYILSKLI